MSHQPLREILRDVDFSQLGDEMLALVERLYPINRSITGEGVRQTLEALSEVVPIDVHEVPTGTPVLDWEVPKEWRVREAYVENAKGERVVDFAAHTLHLLGYSAPTRETMSLEQLREHIFTLPAKPDWIPYRTSYYQERWGFCMAHRELEALDDGEYKVVIDSELKDGSLTYGECSIGGRSPAIVLISSHICHPSLANDNLSALVVSAFLASIVAQAETRYSYRFVYAPGTIGAITWLSRNEESTALVRHGLIAANLGDDGIFHYKRSRRGDATIDRLVEQLLADRDANYEIEDFSPFGYDERQYCSPGFDLPVGSLTRTPWGRYPEYHTSADNPSLLTAENLAESLQLYAQTLEALETNRSYRNLSPKGEPQLGRRGLYRTLGGDDAGRERELAILWVLNQSDGTNDLLSIAERAQLPYRRIREAADQLLAAGLLALD